MNEHKKLYSPQNLELMHGFSVTISGLAHQEKSCLVFFSTFSVTLNNFVILGFYAKLVDNALLFFEREMYFTKKKFHPLARILGKSYFPVSTPLPYLKLNRFI